MKRASLFCLALAVLVFPCAAQSLSSVVDLSNGLKEVFIAAQQASFDPSSFSRLIILEGNIATVDVINREQATYSVELRILQGEWEGTSRVRSYNAIIQVNGPAFFELVPPRKTASSPNWAIGLNDHVLIIGKVVGVVSKYGVRMPVIRTEHIRRIL